jgi:hypothetical protein
MPSRMACLGEDFLGAAPAPGALGVELPAEYTFAVAAARAVEVECRQPFVGAEGRDVTPDVDEVARRERQHVYVRDGRARRIEPYLAVVAIGYALYRGEVAVRLERSGQRVRGDFALADGDAVRVGRFAEHAGPPTARERPTHGDVDAGHLAVDARRERVRRVPRERGEVHPHHARAELRERRHDLVFGHQAAVEDAYVVPRLAQRRGHGQNPEGVPSAPDKHPEVAREDFARRPGRKYHRDFHDFDVLLIYYNTKTPARRSAVSAPPSGRSYYRHIFRAMVTSKTG